MSSAWISFQNSFCFFSEEDQKCIILCIIFRLTRIKVNFCCSFKKKIFFVSTIIRFQMFRHFKIVRIRKRDEMFQHDVAMLTTNFWTIFHCCCHLREFDSHIEWIFIFWSMKIFKFIIFFVNDELFHESDFSSRKKNDVCFFESFNVIISFNKMQCRILFFDFSVDFVKFFLCVFENKIAFQYVIASKIECSLILELLTRRLIKTNTIIAKRRKCCFQIWIRKLLDNWDTIWILRHDDRFKNEKSEKNGDNACDYTLVEKEKKIMHKIMHLTFDSNLSNSCFIFSYRVIKSRTMRKKQTIWIIRWIYELCLFCTIVECM